MCSSLNGIFLQLLTLMMLILRKLARSHWAFKKKQFPAMYQLYLLLKDPTEPPMVEEKAIAISHKSLNAVTTAEYIKKIEKAVKVVPEHRLELGQ